MAALADLKDKVFWYTFNSQGHPLNRENRMEISIKMFADGADLRAIQDFSQNPRVSGFTTNPTLMRKAGVTDYVAFAREARMLVDPLPISFETFSDDLITMREQALIISSWGPNVYVKVPVTNTRGESTTSIIRDLSLDGVKVNVTAVMTVDQVHSVAEALNTTTPSVVSVFAGRIADAGMDPIPTMAESKRILANLPNVELLWASPREILNVVQASNCGCDIITMTSELWAKVSNLGKDLAAISLDTVKMFHRDAALSEFSLTPRSKS